MTYVDNPVLAVMVPSRGRPQALARQHQAMNDTEATVASIVWIVDSDEGPEYTAAALELGVLDDPRFRLIVQPPRRLGPTLNEWGPFLARRFRHVGFMGDDHVPRTVGWDRRIVEQLDSVPYGVTYGNDLIHGPNLPTAAFLSANIIKATGRFVPDGLIHLRMDDYWRDLGTALNRLYYLPDVTIEHVHPIAHKAEWDATYVAANDGAVWEADTVTYNEFKFGGGLVRDTEAVEAGAAA